jgi:RNA polymerase sigma-70 factor (ECF subfamily)
MSADGLPDHRVGSAAVRDATYQQLLEARDGDEEARGRLLERLRPRLILWASSRMSDRLRSRMTAEDVAQEILLSVHRSMAQFRGGDDRAFRAWLFTVAENRVRDLANHTNAQKRRTPEPRYLSQTSPSGHAMRAESVDRLREALERLSPDYREVIRLRRFEELETAAVAEAMDRSPTAIRVLYCRAIRALREEMLADE